MLTTLNKTSYCRCELWSKNIISREQRLKHTASKSGSGKHGKGCLKVNCVFRCNMEPQSSTEGDKPREGDELRLEQLEEGSGPKVLKKRRHEEDGDESSLTKKRVHWMFIKWIVDHVMSFDHNSSVSFLLYLILGLMEIWLKGISCRSFLLTKFLVDVFYIFNNDVENVWVISVKLLMTCYWSTSRVITVSRLQVTTIVCRKLVWLLEVKAESSLWGTSTTGWRAFLLVT